MSLKEAEINYIGPLRIVQAFESNLKKSEKNEADGSCKVALVNIGSIVGFLNMQSSVTYGSSKATVGYLTNAQWIDLG